jgi:hypothetical protein
MRAMPGPSSRASRMSALMFRTLAIASAAEMGPEYCAIWWARLRNAWLIFSGSWAMSCVSRVWAAIADPMMGMVS